MKILGRKLLLPMLLLVPAGTAYGADGSDCSKIQKIVGGEVNQKENVCKAEVPRKNLQVSLMGVPVSPELIELGFEANFEKKDSQTVVTGEFALLGEEVNPVVDALRKGGIEITAIHNHLIGEQPRILYLHFQGIGDQMALAKTVRQAIDAVRKG
ncbi:DUF1259 domain-containing protein [Paenibacillus aurantius]|uniref:DUF1259 domain-containing protein n=1 Tax=Paenibacillus aurantius TaxID=2918900 RepID=A0AA96RAU9_9BACL|nr:DUF1259 domain-containing protein [Paenibacillus aurantius]WNQ08815.1 DUF1259 domain-containing protein [Paenibacillus aurantius]